jgi:hypothetical protein
MYEESIVNTLLDNCVEWLSEKLILQVEDETKAGLVRTGRLQSDPTIYKINITLHPGGSDHKDCVLPPNYAGMNTPYYMNNGVFWLRKFYAYFEMFFVGETERNEARMKANVVMSRARHAILTIPMPASRDSFKEGAVKVVVTEIELQEGGGPGNFIWRGQLNFEFVTDTELDFGT